MRLSDTRPYDIWSKNNLGMHNIWHNMTIIFGEWNQEKNVFNASLYQLPISENICNSGNYISEQ